MSVVRCGGEYFDYVKVDEPEAFLVSIQCITCTCLHSIPFLFCDGCITSVALNPGSVQHIWEYVNTTTALKHTQAEVYMPRGFLLSFGLALES